MSTAFDPRILEFLASRICHDLVSPVGAVCNGVELLEEMGPDPEALGLVLDSAGKASARLKAFRIAYGAGGSDSNIMPRDIHGAFDALLQFEERITMNWDVAATPFPDPLPAGYCKCVINCLMLAKECLPRGGEISVASGVEKTTINATGTGANMSDVAISATQGDIDKESLDPRLVHAYVTGQFARHFGLTLDISAQETDNVVLSLSK